MAILTFKKNPTHRLRWAIGPYGFLELELITVDGSKEPIRLA